MFPTFVNKNLIDYCFFFRLLRVSSTIFSEYSSPTRNDILISRMPPKVKKGNATADDEGAEAIKQNLRDIKYKYQYACTRYGCEPLGYVLKKVEDGIQTGHDYKQVRSSEPAYYQFTYFARQ